MGPQTDCQPTLLPTRNQDFPDCGLSCCTIALSGCLKTSPQQITCGKPLYDVQNFNRVGTMMYSSAYAEVPCLHSRSTQGCPPSAQMSLSALHRKDTVLVSPLEISKKSLRKVYALSEVFLPPHCLDSKDLVPCADEVVRQLFNRRCSVPSNHSIGIMAYEDSLCGLDDDNTFSALSLIC